MNEKKLVMISLPGAFVCLIMLYIVSLNQAYFHVNAGDITGEMVGKVVNVSGEVAGLWENNGHLFFRLEDDSGSVKIVVWRDFRELISEKGLNEIKNGMELNVIGTVEIYRGELEVIPMRGMIYRA